MIGRPGAANYGMSGMMKTAPPTLKKHSMKPTPGRPSGQTCRTGHVRPSSNEVELSVYYFLDFGGSDFGVSDFGASGFEVSGFEVSGFEVSGFAVSGFGASDFGVSGLGVSGFAVS